MASRIQLRRGTLAQWATANPILAHGELAAEIDTFKVKLGNGVTPWNSLPYAFAFTTVPDADETTRGLVEKATPLEVMNGTVLGGSGAPLFVGPAELKNYRDLSESVASLVGSTLTCDCANKVENRFVYNTPISSAFSIVFTNRANSQYQAITLPITGSSIAITFDSATRMARYNEPLFWNPTTKILTVNSTVAGDLHEFSLLKTGSIYILRYDGSIRP